MPGPPPCRSRTGPEPVAPCRSCLTCSAGRAAGGVTTWARRGSTSSRRARPRHPSTPGRHRPPALHKRPGGQAPHELGCRLRAERRPRKERRREQWRTDTAQPDRGNGGWRVAPSHIARTHSPAGRSMTTNPTAAEWTRPSPSGLRLLSSRSGDPSEEGDAQRGLQQVVTVSTATAIGPPAGWAPGPSRLGDRPRLEGAASGGVRRSASRVSNGTEAELGQVQLEAVQDLSGVTAGAPYGVGVWPDQPGSEPCLGGRPRLAPPGRRGDDRGTPDRRGTATAVLQRVTRSSRQASRIRAISCRSVTGPRGREAARAGSAGVR